jgi:hypothetical protein
MKIGDKYRHFKHGTIYHIVEITVDSENLESRASYVADKDIENYGSCKQCVKPWSRPVKMFDDVVEFNGLKVKRFERL